MSEKMKKFNLFIATLFLAGAMSGRIAFTYITNQATTATSATANALYVPVHNEDATAHEVGDVVVWSDNTHDGVDITTTTTANDGLVAGAVAINDIAGDAFGLVQVAGYHSAINTVGVVAAGASVVTSSVAESGTIYTFVMSTGSAQNEAQINGKYATCLAAAASDTCQAIIKAL